jgi:hypothetical protein
MVSLDITSFFSLSKFRLRWSYLESGSLAITGGQVVNNVATA